MGARKIRGNMGYCSVSLDQKAPATYSMSLHQETLSDELQEIK